MGRKSKTLLILILCVPIAFQIIWEISPPMWRIEAKIEHVWFKPEDFISLKELEEKYEDIFSWHTFDGEIFYFEDLDGRAYGQRLLGDKDFLVIYRGDWYVKETEAEKNITEAQKIAELKRKQFSVGEAVEVYNKYYEPISLIVHNTHYCDTHENVELPNEEKLFLIDVTIEESNQSMGSITNMFSHIITAKGTQFGTFIELNDTTVAVALPKDEIVNQIYIKSPFYSQNTRIIEIAQ